MTLTHEKLRVLPRYKTLYTTVLPK